MSEGSFSPTSVPVDDLPPQQQASPPNKPSRSPRISALARAKLHQQGSIFPQEPSLEEEHTSKKTALGGLPSFSNGDRGSLKAKGSFTVGNAKGLHTRPSTELVKCASQFRSHIALRYQKVSVNAKSLLGILTLAAGKGSRIVIEAEGEDAQEAIQALVHLAQNRFFTSF